jgi:hypothetical protein
MLRARLLNRSHAASQRWSLDFLARPHSGTSDWDTCGDHVSSVRLLAPRTDSELLDSEKNIDDNEDRIHDEMIEQDCAYRDPL